MPFLALAARVLWRVLSVIKPYDISDLGNSSFNKDYGLKASYMAGAIVNGIASEELVIAMGKQKYLASFGTGGLRPEKIGRLL